MWGESGEAPLGLVADDFAVWTPLALPALENVMPKFRRGSLVITDNTRRARLGYKDFFDFVHDPKNGFKTLTLPYAGGLEITVYDP